jgi:signal transduction histidine kinase
VTAAWRSRWRAVTATLRARVTLLAALVVLAVLSAASVGLVLAQRAALMEAVDEHLDQQADVVGQAVLASGTRDIPALPGEDVVVEILGPDGELVAASEGLRGRLPLEDRPAAGDGAVTVDLPGGDPGRLLVRDAGGATLVVAASLDDVQDAVTALAGSLLAVVPLSTAVLAGVVWWAVGRALRPVEDIRARVDTISATRLDGRVPEPRTHDEVARLAHTMNAMLARLQHSTEQQRSFVADAAHELRSPLARIRAELEVDAAHPASADLARTHASVLGETVGLQRLVDDLLLLARGDAGALDHVRVGPVDLDHVVDRLVTARRRPDGPRIDTRGVGPVQVRGDEAQLGRAVGNLLDNAVRHARATVTVTLEEAAGGGVRLAVADDGPGILLEDHERVFERFTRLDEARSADGGAGLGLAIARDIARRHGGDVTLDGEWPGARFVLALPGDGVSRPGDPGRA